MKKIIKGYDVYFTLQAPASVLIEAENEKKSMKEAEKVLSNMSKKELIDRLLCAYEYEGLKIEYLDEVDEMEIDE